MPLPAEVQDVFEELRSAIAFTQAAVEDYFNAQSQDMQRSG